MKFVIVTPARSGSTPLREMLDSHPEVCCSGEVFGQLRVRGLSTNSAAHVEPDLAFRIRKRDPAAFLAKHVYASARPAAGFKILYSQLFVMDALPAIAWLQDRPGLRVVHLWRRDLVARHVSEIRLRQRARDQKTEPLPAGFVERMLRPHAVLRSCEVQLAARRNVNRMFAGHPMLSLDYEDFIADHATQSRRLCEFLGVDPAGWPALKAKEDRPDPELVALRAEPALQPFIDHA